MFHDPYSYSFEEMKRMSLDYYDFEYPNWIRDISDSIFDMFWVPEESESFFGASKKKMVIQGMAAGRKCDQLANITTWFDTGYQDYRTVLSTIKVPALVFAPCPGSEFDFTSNEYYRDHLGGPVEFVVLEPGTHLALMEHFRLA